VQKEAIYPRTELPLKFTPTNHTPVANLQSSKVRGGKKKNLLRNAGQAQMGVTRKFGRKEVENPKVEYQKRRGGIGILRVEKEHAERP